MSAKMKAMGGVCENLVAWGKAGNFVENMEDMASLFDKLEPIALDAQAALALPDDDWLDPAEPPEDDPVLPKWVLVTYVEYDSCGRELYRVVTPAKWDIRQPEPGWFDVVNSRIEHCQRKVVGWRYFMEPMGKK